jgi:hypothetical protein
MPFLRRHGLRPVREAKKAVKNMVSNYLSYDGPVKRGYFAVLAVYAGICLFGGLITGQCGIIETVKTRL